MILRHTTALCLVALLLCFARTGCAVDAGNRPSLHLYPETHEAMATTFSLFLYARSKTEADEEASIAFAELIRIEDLLSNYRESSRLTVTRSPRL